MAVKYVVIYLLLLIACQLSPTDQSVDEQLYDCICSDDSPTKLGQSIGESEDYLKSRMSHYSLPGLGVGVSRDGQHIWRQSFGWSDIENPVPTRTDSVWRMASISKALTSAMIGHLIDRQLIDLNQSIHEYLTEDVFPIKQWNGRNVSITLSQLMSHSAGIRVSKSLEEDYRTIYEFKNVTDSLRQFKDEPLLSEPGTHYNYSNFGFQVLGAVVEAVLNQSFDVAVDDMFRRLAMNSTFCEKHDMIIKHRVRDYIRSDSPLLPEDQRSGGISQPFMMNAMLMDDLLPFEAQWPSGAIVSTTEDLLTYGNHLLSRYNSDNDTHFDFLSPSAVKQIWSPVIEKYKNEFGSNMNAHGWAITQLDHPVHCTGKCHLPSIISKVIWKTGQLTGATSIIMIVAEQHIIVAIVTNNSNFDNIFEAALIVAKNFMY